MGETMVMNQAERDRLNVIRQASEGRIRRREAAERLDVTTRQVRRLVVEYRKRGDLVAIHGLRGAEGNRGKRREDCIRELVSFLHREHYPDYGPTLFVETLAERHQLEIARETARRWLARSGAREPRAARRERHPRRERRRRRGELVQLDTSTHLWFEGRGGTAYGYLICAIDDATSEVYGRFYDGDTSLANMDMIRRWIERSGRPEAFYFDRAGHFAGDTDEDGGDARHRTQVGRMLGELGVEPILARSPQAKGRVERTFRTHQDRLVKKLRERGIATIEAANEYIEREYWDAHNRKFARRAAEQADAHRALTSEQRRRMGEITSVRDTRTLQAGDVVKYEGRTLLVKIQGRRGPRRGATIEVLEAIDGTRRLRHEGRDLAWEDVSETAVERAAERRAATRQEARREKRARRLEKAGIAATADLTELQLQALRPLAKPAPDHPWRRPAKRASGPQDRTGAVAGPPARDKGKRGQAGSCGA